MGVLLLVIFVILFIIGVPIAFGIGGSALIAMIIERGLDFDVSILVQRSVSGIDNFLLLAVPLFIYAGKMMNTGGITTRIFEFAKAMVGSLRGGLGHVNVFASVIFAGMTGTAVADAAGLGAVELKAMKDAGYKDDFAVAITGASSTVGPIIPPSVPLVIYGLMTGVSIGGILIAGIVPGLILALALSITIFIYAKKTNMPKGEPFKIKVAWNSFRHAFFPLLTPLIIIVGMVSGVFTPTEAAAIAAAYATILSTMVYKEITWGGVWKVMKETAIESGAIMLIVSMSMIFGYLITLSGITETLVAALGEISTNPIVIGLILMAFFLFLGCFMEATAAITILSPVLLPIFAFASIDPMHFGIVMVITMMIGLLTPPFGMVLFVLNRLSGLSVFRVSKAVLPYVIALIIATIILIIFPEITLFLPNLLL